MLHATFSYKRIPPIKKKKVTITCYIDTIMTLIKHTFKVVLTKIHLYTFKVLIES